MTSRCPTEILERGLVTERSGTPTTPWSKHLASRCPRRRTRPEPSTPNMLRQSTSAGSLCRRDAATGSRKATLEFVPASGRAALTSDFHPRLVSSGTPYKDAGLEPRSSSSRRHKVYRQAYEVITGKPSLPIFRRNGVERQQSAALSDIDPDAGSSPAMRFRTPRRRMIENRPMPHQQEDYGAPRLPPVRPATTSSRPGWRFR